VLTSPHFQDDTRRTDSNDMSKLQEALSTLAPARLQGLRRGIEKESLRATLTGALAATPHPQALGSALTHPNITTDYSESQLELITGVHASVEQCLEELTQVHQYVYRALGDELMWVSSMPCMRRPTRPFPSAATARPMWAAPRASIAWAWRTATAGACRPSPASTTTGRCRA
jgi:hypothetical protein